MATLQKAKLRYKIATEDWEFDAIHRLNYQTFVDEIPQHPQNENGRLVDRFHDKNCYIIAVSGRRLLGMIAMRGHRPFSLDHKLPDLDKHLPPGRRVCEIRLLATTSESRNGVIFRGLAERLIEHGLARGYDCGIISGTLRQARLYQHLGFQPFGPLVGAGDALYQPMMLTYEDFLKRNQAIRVEQGKRPRAPLNFLPGPVAATKAVRRALARPAVSHRCEEFRADFAEVRRRLCSLVKAPSVEMMMGSGTLANDAVAAQVAAWNAPGLVMSNGAFGDRLVDHAKRFQLPFRVLRADWGRAFDPELVRATANAEPTSWIWAVHGETSTGVLNDLNVLKTTAEEVGAKLCLDAVSSIGVAPVDLRGVALASSVSGKGLASLAGLSFVFHDRPLAPIASAPRVLDLGFYAEQDGVPFTVSSNLLAALKMALRELQPRRRLARVQRMSEYLRAGLAELGIAPVADPSNFAAVTTIAAPQGLSSVELGRRMEALGCQVHFRSGYLPPRNWIQFCMMSRVTPLMVDRALGVLRRVLER